MTRRPRSRGVTRKTPRRWRGLLAPGPLGLGLLAVALVVAGIVWSYAGQGPGARQGASTVVVVSPGSGLARVARDLKAAGVIRSRLVFMGAAAATGAAHRLKAGEYEIRSGESLADILSALRHGLVVRRSITIPEGLTSRAAVEILRQADFLTGPVAVPAEGALLPETYEVRPGDSRRSVLARMTTARDRLLAELWRDRAPGLPFQSADQAVILASVVERETALAAERPRVAAVFINRLRKGMRLESDPTVIYGLTGGAPLGHGLRQSELASRTAYNTYLVAGLPPTPIANPGRAALAAVLNPAHTDALYFVADGTGGHVFTDTFEAHRRNVARWRRIEPKTESKIKPTGRGGAPA